MSMSVRASDPIQVRRFDGGGFVLHKVKAPSGKMKVSGWYDIDGNLQDAEMHSLFKRSLATYPVKKGGPIWRMMERKGKTYARIKGVTID